MSILLMVLSPVMLNLVKQKVRELSALHTDCTLRTKSEL